MTPDRRKKFGTFEESPSGLSLRGGSEAHFDVFKTAVAFSGPGGLGGWRQTGGEENTWHLAFRAKRLAPVGRSPLPQVPYRPPGCNDPSFLTPYRDDDTSGGRSATEIGKEECDEEDREVEAEP